MTHELPDRETGRPDARLPFETTAGARFTAAIASVVITLAIVGAVVLGITDEANGPILALVDTSLEPSRA